MRPALSHIRDYLSHEESKVRMFFIIFYSVGIAGIAVPGTRNIFTGLTPVALLLSLIALLFFHRPVFDKRTIACFSLIYLISFLIEVAGVKTGLIFGDYSYGTGLGIRILETPLLIGLNWVMLLYCTAVMTDKMLSPVMIKIILASLLMVLYDIILELVAPQLDMWNFTRGSAPVLNYISWFILAVLFHTLIKYAGIKSINSLAAFIFYCQQIFFLVLIIILKLTE